MIKCANSTCSKYDKNREDRCNRWNYECLEICPDFVFALPEEQEPTEQCGRISCSAWTSETPSKCKKFTNVEDCRAFELWKQIDKGTDNFIEEEKKAPTRPVVWWTYEHSKDEMGKVFWDKVHQGEATFHCFGQDYEEISENIGIFSTAIIELPDGNVKNVPVNQIKFLDWPRK